MLDSVTRPTVAGAGLKLTVGVANETGVAPLGMAVTVMVNVCGWPTSLTSFGAMAMLASTYRFVAGPLPPGPATTAVAGSVSWVTVTPAMVIAWLALMVKTPAVGLLV